MPTVGDLRNLSRRLVASGWATSLVVGLLALAIRLLAVGGVDGLRAVHGYDDGVYFSGAVALAHGSLPYRDFWFLHPPGVLVALSPFGAATHLAPDSAVLVAARLAVIGIGALTAVLLTRIAREWGHGAMAVAGVVYAVWPAAVVAERVTLLEPFGGCAIVAAVLAARRFLARDVTGRWPWLAGALLGFALTVKIWNVVPVAVVLVWFAVLAGRRRGLRLLLAAGLAAAVVVVPFAVAGGSRMWRMVVLDQLGRGHAPVPPTDRLAGVVGVDRGVLGSTEPAGVAVVLVVLVVAAAICAVTRRARLWVVLAVTQGAMVVLSPSYFSHYAALVAPAIAMVLAGGYGGLGVLAARADGARVAVATIAPLSVALVVVSVLPVQLIEREVRPFPTAELGARLPEEGCVRADSPVNLVLLDRLSSAVDQGCQEPIDVSGRAYEIGPRTATGAPVPRVRNPQWQEEILGYLTSGPAAVLTRGVGNGFDTDTAREIDRRTVWRAGTTRLVINDAPAAEAG